jgi:hypothetical protein
MSTTRYFSHSRCETDETCRRARYLGSEWGGTGLSAVGQGWELTYGNLIHKHLKDLALSSSIDYIAARLECYKAAIDSGLSVQLAHDWSAMAEGHLRGFVKAVWPAWMAEYTVVEAEQLRSWDAWSGLTDGQPRTYRYRFIQDLLLKNKFNGSIRYVDYKTTSNDDAKWIASWAKSTQLHGSAHALKQLGIEVDDMLVCGLYKGWKDKKTGGPGSIFCKGWVNRAYSMMPEYSYTYQRGKGWEAFSVASEFDDLSEWVANMPLDILSAQFPLTGPIPPRDDIAETWFRQQLIREAEVAAAVHDLQFVKHEAEVTSIMDTAFRQNFSKCQPAWGYGCQFDSICWVPAVGADPIGSGQFIRREQRFEDGDA